MVHRPRLVVTVSVLLASLIPSVAVACLWDYDTIKMERARFPDTLELITGKFLRHSPEFYQWRIADRLKRLEADPSNPSLLDDLAVAYDKTGQHDKAIETALRTELAHPGRYETAANLGTIYLHAGHFEEGLTHIGRALRINPDAHFGREKYQRLLAEYVLPRREDGRPRLPLATVTVYPSADPDSPSAREVGMADTFADFLRDKAPDGRLGRDEVDAAVRGVLGMMKFGKHDSPVLLEALGTLLTHGGGGDPTHDAKLLAARAYLRASYEAPDGPARVAYRGMAAAALRLQTPRRDKMGQVSLEQVEADFQRELSEARGWYTELREKEVTWVRSGQNPEAEFDKLHDAAPEMSGMDVRDPMSADERMKYQLLAAAIIVVVAVLAVVVGGVILVWRRLRR